MKAVFTAVLLVALTTAVPALLLAKGPTVKITIQDPELAAPIEITDPNVRQFFVWSGPGTFINEVEGREGFIIDWTKAIAEAPQNLPHYEVSFYTGCESGDSNACRMAEPSLTYVVSYAYDSSTEQGFVYLPGGRDKF